MARKANWTIATLLKTTWMRVALGLVGLLCLALIIGARGQAHSPTTHGSLVFSDDFEGSSISDKYRIGTPDLGHKAGTWTVEDGRLKAVKIHNAALWLKQELPRSVRIEFTAKAHSDEGDIKAEVFGDGRTHQSGYILLFGGWKNSVRAIARLDEHGEDRKNDNRCQMRGGRRRCVEKGVDYKWTIERTDHVVKWYINDRLLLTYPDQHPVQGRHFAFNNWEPEVSFDNLKIFDLDR